MPFSLSQPILARVFPFAIFIVFLALKSALGDDAPFDVRWLYVARAVVVAAALAWFWRQYDELKGNVAMPGGIWALSVVSGLAVFVLWIHLDASWMLMGERGGGFDPRDGDRINWLLVAFRLAGMALVVPVMEELFWRSFLMRWIDNPRFQAVVPALVTAKALLVSSVVFGFEHNEWFAGILAGLAYAWLYRFTGNLWAPIVSHAVTNGLLGIWVLYTGAWHFW